MAVPIKLVCMLPSVAHLTDFTAPSSALLPAQDLLSLRLPSHDVLPELTTLHTSKASSNHLAAAHRSKVNKPSSHCRPSADPPLLLSAASPVPPPSAFPDTSLPPRRPASRAAQLIDDQRYCVSLLG